MQDYIRICDVEKYYGTASNVTKAVDRVSFGVDRGEFVGVMGPSGSGKTTLLNMLATIDRVTSGHIYYENTDITELSEDALSDFRKNNLGFVFQDYNLLDTLTIEENILLALTMQDDVKVLDPASASRIAADQTKTPQIETAWPAESRDASPGHSPRSVTAQTAVSRNTTAQTKLPKAGAWAESKKSLITATRFCACWASKIFGKNSPIRCPAGRSSAAPAPGRW